MNLLEIKWFTDARLTKKKLNNISSISLFFFFFIIYFYNRLFVLKFYQHDI